MTNRQNDQYDDPPAGWWLILSAIIVVCTFGAVAIIAMYGPTRTLPDCAKLNSNETYVSPFEPIANFIRGGTTPKKKCK